MPVPIFLKIPFLFNLLDGLGSDQKGSDPTGSSSATLLKVHRRSQHRKIVYPCTGCDYTAKVQSHLRQHIRSVHEKVRYPCDACDSTFINNSRLKHHKQTVHSGLRFTCERHTLDVMNSKTMKKVKI